MNQRSDLWPTQHVCKLHVWMMYRAWGSMVSKYSRGIYVWCVVPRLCLCLIPSCLHMFKATLDWYQLPASCLCLIVLSFQHWSVTVSLIVLLTLWFIFSIYYFMLLFTLLFSSLLIILTARQTVARDLINRRVKAVTWGHSWCVYVCVRVWNPIQTSYLLPGSSSALTQRCDTREFVASRLLQWFFRTNTVLCMARICYMKNEESDMK